MAIARQTSLGVNRLYAKIVWASIDSSPVLLTAINVSYVVTSHLRCVDYRAHKRRDAFYSTLMWSASCKAHQFLMILGSYTSAHACADACPTRTPQLLQNANKNKYIYRSEWQTRTVSAKSYHTHRIGEYYKRRKLRPPALTCGYLSFFFYERSGFRCQYFVAIYCVARLRYDMFELSSRCM